VLAEAFEIQNIPPPPPALHQDKTMKKDEAAEAGSSLFP
jgi:hypothetical protein